VINEEQLNNVEHFNYLGSMISKYARCKGKIKFRLAKAKTAFKKKTLFTSKLDSNLRKKLVK
jgi:CRISPR/Cas system-associated exonuclease Cas4 (RecB family)